MTTKIDFDAFRAEQKHEPVILHIGGKDYELAPSIPATLALDIMRMKDENAKENASPQALMDVGAGLFGSAKAFADVMRSAQVTLEELPDLIRMVIEAYQSGGATAPATGEA